MVREPATAAQTSARPARQARAQDKSDLIRNAASRIISTHGIAGLTHRLIAQTANVSLAATTYHYQSKADIIRAATQATLESYDRSLNKALSRFRREPATRESFSSYFNELMQNTAGSARQRAICWGEIMLDVARRPESHANSQAWFARLTSVWVEMADACGLDQSDQSAIVAIDILIGLLFLIVGLGLSGEDMMCTVPDTFETLRNRPLSAPPPGSDLAMRDGARAVATRAKVLAATIEILKREGAGAVTRKAVAASAGLTKTAPFYYYPSIADLLAAAQKALFLQSKVRYRQGLVEAGGVDVDFERLIDRTAAVFLREATEFAGDSIATFSIWLRADNEPLVRAMVREAAIDQERAWRGVLGCWSGRVNPIDPLLAQALFIGKLVRILATGSRIQDLALIRREFAFGLKDVMAGAWSDKATCTTG